MEENFIKYVIYVWLYGIILWWPFLYVWTVVDIHSIVVESFGLDFSDGLTDVAVSVCVRPKSLCEPWCVFSASLPCVTVRRMMMVDRMRVWGQGLQERGQLLPGPPAAPLSGLGRSGSSDWRPVTWAGGFDTSSPIRRSVAESATSCADSGKHALCYCTQLLLFSKIGILSRQWSLSNTRVEKKRVAWQGANKPVQEITAAIQHVLWKDDGSITHHIPLSVSPLHPVPKVSISSEGNNPSSIYAWWPKRVCFLSERRTHITA